MHELWELAFNDDSDEDSNDEEFYECIDEPVSDKYTEYPGPARGPKKGEGENCSTEY